MYCKFCGDTIDEKSIFCNTCGKPQTRKNAKSGERLHASGESDIGSSAFKMILISIILAGSYFVGWIKVAGSSGKTAEFIAAIFGRDISEISPRDVMKGFDYLKEVASVASGTIPFECYMLYFLLAIPILAGFCIILSLLKMRTAGSVGKLTAFISLCCEAYAWYLSTQANISASIWLYFLTAASIYFFFVLRSSNPEYELTTENIDISNAKEAAASPEASHRKVKGTNLIKANEKGYPLAGEFDVCFYCGADIKDETKLCPVCGKNINK